MKDISPTFCILPFTHLNTKTNGEFKLCCRSLPLYNVKEKSLLEVWNSEKVKSVRKKMLSGERPEECRECWSHEDQNVRSLRQRENWMKCEIGTYLNVLSEVNYDYSMPPKMRSIELKLNNLCNLKCRMCHPVDSVLWAKDWPLISRFHSVGNEWTYNNVDKYNLVETPYLCEWENHPSFFEDLEKIADSLDTVWFAGGESLIDPMHYKLLDKLKGRGISLQYATNLTRLTFKGRSVLDYWKHFKRVLIGVSFDGLYDVFEYIRTGSKFDAVNSNMLAIREEAEKVQSNLIIYAACTFQAYNIFDLPEIFDYLLEKKIWINTHRVSYPKFLSSQILPKGLKNIVTKKLEKFISSVSSRDIEVEFRNNAKKNAIDNLNFMNGNDLSELWPQFLEYNKVLDERLKGKTIEEIRPEIGDYM